MKELFTSIKIWAKDFFKTEDPISESLAIIKEELDKIETIERNFKDVPGSKLSLRKLHAAKLQIMLFAYYNAAGITFDSLIDNMEEEQSRNITLAWIYKKGVGAEEEETYRFTCNRDRSSKNPKFFFMISSEGMNCSIEEFKEFLELQTVTDWHFKVHCSSNHYIFWTFDVTDADRINFDLKLKFIPHPNRFITKTIQED
jgi:hypothetical protein